MDGKKQKGGRIGDEGQDWTTRKTCTDRHREQACRMRRMPPADGCCDLLGGLDSGPADDGIAWKRIDVMCCGIDDIGGLRCEGKQPKVG